MEPTAGVQEDNMVTAEARVTALHMGLAAAMVLLRKESGITPQELSSRLDKAEIPILRLQSAFRSHSFDEAIRYFAALDAELLVSVRKSGHVYQISDPHVAQKEV